MTETEGIFYRCERCGGTLGPTDEVIKTVRIVRRRRIDGSAPEEPRKGAWFHVRCNQPADHRETDRGPLGEVLARP
jgi:hypothetical protein